MAVLAYCFKLERLVPRILIITDNEFDDAICREQSSFMRSQAGGLLWLSASMSSFAGEKARHPAQGSKRSQEADRESMEHRAGVLSAV